MKTVVVKLFLCLIVIGGGCSHQKEQKPNIILIVADDLGFADIAYEDDNDTITPNIRRLAKEGMRLTHFYANAPVCSPTRTALMTGQYQHRWGIESALGPNDKGLPVAAMTVADYMKRNGYATAVFGKWHLGTAPEENPVRRGFDEFRGHLNSVDYHAHIGPWGNRDWWVNDNLQNEEGYNAALITKHAVRFINEHKEAPFFLYLPFSNIHFPWCTPDDPEFWQEGVSYYESIETKLGPHSPHENITPVVKRMIYELDKSVGQIMEAIKNNELDKETLVIFTSDNGGYIHYNGRHKGQISDNGPLKGQKGDLYEGGIRVSAVARWIGKIQEGSESEEAALSMDLLPTFMELIGQASLSADNSNAFDGITLAPILFKQGKLPERTLFWRTKNKCAVRKGPWKLVFNRSAPFSPELYNLMEDEGELHNIEQRYPEIVSELQDEFRGWEQRIISNK